MSAYFLVMYRPAPPAPIRTAFVTFVIAVAVALLVAPHPA